MNRPIRHDLLAWAVVTAFSLLLVGVVQAQTVADAIDDGVLETALREQAVELLEAGKTVPAAALREQLKRPRCETARLPALSTRRLEPTRSYVQARDRILIIGGLYKCSKCEQWHVSTSAAFPLAGPDVFVSNYHVFKDTNTVAFVGMTRQRLVRPVAEILAASQTDDIAIVRIPGLNVAPLALRTDAPVGTPVVLISHPQTHFFSFSQGAIAHYSRHDERNGRTHLLMDITAEFAKGSSGAPILDECGNAVGMVASTRAVFYDQEKFQTVQMVFRQCIPAASIRALLTPSRKE